MGCVYTVANGEVIDADHHNSQNTLAGQAIKQGLMSGIHGVYNSFCGSYGDLTPYDDAIVDIYSDSGGYLNTVNTGNTTANYDDTNDWYTNLCNLTTALCSANFCVSTGGWASTACCNCVIACSRIDAGQISSSALTCNCAEVPINTYNYLYMCVSWKIDNSCFFVSAKNNFVYAGVTLHSCTSVNTVGSYEVEFCKTAACCFDYYIDGVCSGNINCETAPYRLCSAYTQSSSGSGSEVCSYIKVTEEAMGDISATIIEIDAQSFDSTTNAIFPTLEVVSGSRDDITVDVEDESSNNLACDVSLDDFGNLCTCCECVLVKYKLGSCDFKAVKAHGFKVLSL